MLNIRWGILGAAGIAKTQVIPALQQSVHCDLQAIASRKLFNAQKTARAFHIPRAYGGYEQLLDDSEIDAIYIPLPNHLHVPWTIRCLEAGKHVLCEKPISMDAAEARHLLEVVQDYPALKVMEAFMYRFHPQWQRVGQLIKTGEIGELKSVHSVFTHFMEDPRDIRNCREWGGGALMDLGCYNISFARFLFDAEPRFVRGRMEIDPRYEVDRMTTGCLDFECGASSFTCGSRMEPCQRVQAFGTEGLIEIELPVSTPHDRPCRIRLQKKKEQREILVEVGNHYQLQCDAFSRAILYDTAVPTPLEDALSNMIVIDAIRKSNETGSDVMVSRE